MEAVVSWLVLVISGALEAVWATALGRSEGFSRLVPSIVFLVACAASMAGLSYAVRDLPVGTAYAVWVGIGAVLTVGYAMATGTEPVSVLKFLFLAMIVGGVVGLKLTHAESPVGKSEGARPAVPSVVQHEPGHEQGHPEGRVAGPRHARPEAGRHRNGDVVPRPLRDGRGGSRSGTDRPRHLAGPRQAP